MEERIKEIRGMVNDCARLFKQYVSDHNMAAFNKGAETVIEKYGNKRDIIDLLLWYGQRVQGLHDEWRKEHGSNT